MGMEITSTFMEIRKSFLVMTAHGEWINARERVFWFIQTARCSSATSIRTKFAGMEFCTMIKGVTRFSITGTGKMI